MPAPYPSQARLEEYGMVTKTLHFLMIFQKLMGVGTHYPKVYGFPGNHANRATARDAVMLKQCAIHM